MNNDVNEYIVFVFEFSAFYNHISHTELHFNMESTGNKQETKVKFNKLRIMHDEK